MKLSLENAEDEQCLEEIMAKSKNRALDIIDSLELVHIDRKDKPNINSKSESERFRIFDSELPKQSQEVNSLLSVWLLTHTCKFLGELFENQEFD